MSKLHSKARKHKLCLCFLLFSFFFHAAAAIHQTNVTSDSLIYRNYASRPRMKSHLAGKQREVVHLWHEIICGKCVELGKVAVVWTCGRGPPASARGLYSESAEEPSAKTMRRVNDWASKPLASCCCSRAHGSHRGCTCFPTSAFFTSMRFFFFLDEARMYQVARGSRNIPEAWLFRVSPS